MVKSRYIGDGHPTFNRNPYFMGISTPTIGLMSLSPLLYGNVMGVDRPDRTDGIDGTPMGRYTP